MPECRVGGLLESPEERFWNAKQRECAESWLSAQRQLLNITRIFLSFAKLLFLLFIDCFLLFNLIIILIYIFYLRLGNFMNVINTINYF